MADETKNKRAFHEDIFAEEPEKWSWPVPGTNSRVPSANVNYETHTSEVRSGSSCSSTSEDGFILQGDSNSQSRSTRKQESTSASEGNNQDDTSSSPHIKARDRLPPSIYDESAQSGNPSGTYEIKDLAFRSSFKKGLASPSGDRSRESSLLRNEREKSQASDKDRPKERRSSSNVSLSPKRKESGDSRSRKSPSYQRSKSSKSRSKSRDTNSSRRSRSRSRDRRTKSPRGDRWRKSASRDRRRSRSRDRRHPRSRSREFRRRSRSRSYDRRRRRGRQSSSQDRYRKRRHSRSRSRSRDRSKGTAHKPGSISLSSSGIPMTPQMALQQTMAAMSAKAQALTGIALPKYYNPAAVNPLKYAEQVQKRKLLWQTKEKVEEQQPKNTVWDKLTFAQDQDGKMTAKFRKLMGIKKESGSPEEVEEKESVLKKQEDLFRDLDQQYEMARVTTHTQRGVGLGYSAQTLYPPVQK